MTESMTEKIYEEHNEEDLRRARRRKSIFLIRSQHLIAITLNDLLTDLYVRDLFK